MAQRETIVKKSKKCVCELTLKELGITRDNCVFLDDENAIKSDAYKNLVLFSPSSQSYLGAKLSKKIQKHIDELILYIKNELDIKNTYFFASYSSNNENKEDLHNKIKADSKPFLFLYSSNNFTESLYASIRNALAHGNIIKKGKFYYLFSVSSKCKSNCSDFDKNLSFLLRLHKLDNLDVYIKAFKQYN